MELIFDIISSDIFQKFIITPLAVVGLYQIIRSVGNQIEEDIQCNNFTGWAINGYIALTILGIISFISIFT